MHVYAYCVFCHSQNMCSKVQIFKGIILLAGSYAVDHYRTLDPYDEGFLLDLKLRICIPYDGQSFCIPDDKGVDIMVGQKVPVCSPASLTEMRSEYV